MSKMADVYIEMVESLTHIPEIQDYLYENPEKLDEIINTNDD